MRKGQTAMPLNLNSCVSAKCQRLPPREYLPVCLPRHL